MADSALKLLKLKSRRLENQRPRSGVRPMGMGEWDGKTPSQPTGVPRDVARRGASPAHGAADSAGPALIQGGSWDVLKPSPVCSPDPRFALVSAPLLPLPILRLPSSHTLLLPPLHTGSRTPPLDPHHALNGTASVRHSPAARCLPLPARQARAPRVRCDCPVPSSSSPRRRSPSAPSPGPLPRACFPPSLPPHPHADPHPRNAALSQRVFIAPEGAYVQIQ